MGGNSRINNEHNLNVYSATSSYNTEQQYMSSSLNALLYNTNHQSGGSFDNSFKQAQLSKPLQTIKLNLSSLDDITETTVTHSDLPSPFNALLYNTNYYDKYDNNAERQLQLKRDPNYNEFYTKTDACAEAQLCWEPPSKTEAKFFTLPENKGFISLHESLYNIMILLAEFRKNMKSILLRLTANNKKVKTFVKTIVGDVKLKDSRKDYYKSVHDLGVIMVQIEDSIKIIMPMCNNIINEILYYTAYLVIKDPNAKQDLQQESKLELEPEVQTEKQGIFKKIKQVTKQISDTVHEINEKTEKTIPLPLQITKTTQVTIDLIKPLINGIKHMSPKLKKIENFLACLQMYVPKIKEVTYDVQNTWPQYVVRDNEIQQNTNYLKAHQTYLTTIQIILTELYECIKKEDYLQKKSISKTTSK